VVFILLVEFKIRNSNVIDVILNHGNNTFSRGILNLHSLKYLHLDEGIFCQVRRLAWCNDPESFAAGSVATGRTTLAGQVKGEHTDKERYTGLPGWGSMGQQPITRKKKKTHSKNLEWSLRFGQRRTTL